jgi:hypothetical protein
MGYFDKYLPSTEEGTGIDIPVRAPGLQVSPQDQVLRDKARLALLEKEYQADPNDPALTKEITTERSKQGAAAPKEASAAGVFDKYLPKEPTPQTKKPAPAEDSPISDYVGQVLLKALPNGIPQPLVDFAAGATSFPRNIANFVKKGAGEAVFPSSVSEGSGWQTAGELVDPFALATGVKGAQLLGKVPGFAAGGYEALRGKGILDAAKAAARNVASGAVTGGAMAGVQGQDPLMGAAFGGAVPGGMSAVGAGRNFVSEATGPLREAWRTAQMRSMLKDTVGEPTLQRVQQEIANSGAGGTVGDIVARAGNTGAAPLAAIEAAVSKDPRLAGTAKSLQQETQATRESDIGRFAKTPEAIDQAVERRTAITDPMRADTLEAANIPGKAPKYLQPALADVGLVAIKPDDINKALGKIRVAPGNKANPTVQSAMDEVQSLLEGAVKSNGSVDANELYTLRKQAGNVINKYASENKDWDKRFTSGLLMDVQKKIDDTIENAVGNTGAWNRYLDVYTKRSKGIDQMKLGQELLAALRGPTGQSTPGSFARKARALEGEMETTLSPKQQQAVDRVSESVDTEAAKKALSSNIDTSGFMSTNRRGEVRVPHIMSRTASVTNALLNVLGQGADSKVTRDMGNLMLTNPKEFSKKYLADLPPEQASLAIKALRESGNLRYPVVSAATSEEK